MTRNGWTVLLALMLFASGAAIAEGGKVRGDKGDGEVVQKQIRLAEPESPYVAETPAALPEEPEPLPPGYEMLEDASSF